MTTLKIHCEDLESYREYAGGKAMVSNTINICHCKEGDDEENDFIEIAFSLPSNEQIAEALDYYGEEDDSSKEVIGVISRSEAKHLIAYLKAAFDLQ